MQKISIYSCNLDYCHYYYSCTCIYCRSQQVCVQLILYSHCSGSQVLKVAVRLKGVQIHEHTLKQDTILGLWETRDGVTASKHSVVCKVLHTYCIAHGSRFLHPEGLHHLEDVHYSLHLAPLNGGGYGTEHARAAHRVTAGNTHTVHCHTRCS